MHTIIITPADFDDVTSNSRFLSHELFPENLPYEIGRTDEAHYVCHDWKAWRAYVSSRRHDPADLWHPSPIKDLTLA